MGARGNERQERDIRARAKDDDGRSTTVDGGDRLPTRRNGAEAPGKEAG